MFGIYLTPSIIAVVRGHRRWLWIGVLNFAAGWTGAGWIAALVWSVDGNTPASSNNADRQHCAQDCSARGGVNPVLGIMRL